MKREFRDEFLSALSSLATDNMHLQDGHILNLDICGHGLVHKYSYFNRINDKINNESKLFFHYNISGNGLMSGVIKFEHSELTFIIDTFIKLDDYDLRQANSTMAQVLRDLNNSCADAGSFFEERNCLFFLARVNYSDLPDLNGDNALLFTLVPILAAYTPILPGILHSNLGN